jgi:hypothetical protein
MPNERVGAEKTPVGTDQGATKPMIALSRSRLVLVLIAFAAMVVAGIAVLFSRFGQNRPTANVATSSISTDGLKVLILYPTGGPISTPESATSGGAFKQVITLGGDKQGKVVVVIDHLRLEVDGRDYGLVEPGGAVVVDARQGVKVTVGNAERQALATRDDSTIPAGSFRLSVEDRGSSDSHIEKIVTVDLPPLKAQKEFPGFGQRYCLVGVNADFENMSRTVKFPGTMAEARISSITNKARIRISLQAVQKKDTEDRDIMVALAGGPETPSGEPGFPMTCRLKKGSKLTKGFSLDVHPGLYKVGKAVRLGRLLHEDVELPVILFVVDK